MTPSLLETLTGHPFLAGLPQGAVGGIADLAASYDLPEGYRLFFEDDPADRFYLLEHGRVALDLHVPGRGPVIVETLGGGDVIGWSWLCPPHRWRFGAVVLKPARVVAVDGANMRAICDNDPLVGYEITRRLLAVVADRLHATRVRFLDLYAARPRDQR